MERSIGDGFVTEIEEDEMGLSISDRTVRARLVRKGRERKRLKRLGGAGWN